MAVTPPTVADFIAKFPEFEDVDPSVITDALADAGRNVDDTWIDADFTNGYLLYAAHVVAAGQLSAGSGGAGGRIVAESLGPISVTYERNASAYDADVLGSTTYGQRYLRLLMLNRGGPRIV